MARTQIIQPPTHRPGRFAPALLVLLLMPAARADTAASDNDAAHHANTDVAITKHSNLNAADARALYGADTGYTIRRNGKRIGEHQVRIEDQADGFTVTIESRINVKILGLSVYTLNYYSLESWKNGALTRVETRTDDYGKITTSLLQHADDKIMITMPDGSNSILPDTQQGALLPSNHWFAGIVAESTLFNTITGKLSQVTIEPELPDASMPDSSTDLTLEQYRYTGDIEIQAWYSQQGLWYGMQFEGTDGSSIRYELNAASATSGQESGATVPVRPSLSGGTLLVRRRPLNRGAGL